MISGFKLLKSLSLVGFLQCVKKRGNKRSGQRNFRNICSCFENKIQDNLINRKRLETKRNVKQAYLAIITFLVIVCLAARKLMKYTPLLKLAASMDRKFLELSIFR